MKTLAKDFVQKLSEDVQQQPSNVRSTNEVPRVNRSHAHIQHLHPTHSDFNKQPPVLR